MSHRSWGSHVTKTNVLILTHLLLSAKSISSQSRHARGDGRSWQSTDVTRWRHVCARSSVESQVLVDVITKCRNCTKNKDNKFFTQQNPSYHPTHTHAYLIWSWSILIDITMIMIMLITYPFPPFTHAMMNTFDWNCVWSWSDNVSNHSLELIWHCPFPWTIPPPPPPVMHSRTPAMVHPLL